MSLQAYNSATDTLTPIAESDYKDSLEEISALPTASTDLLNKCYLLTANQVGYVKGGIYQCQLVEASYEWVLVSQNPLEAGKGITIEDDTVNADTNVFNGTLDEWEALTADEKANYSHIATPEEADVTSGYSTTETKTGATWIDGKPIYRVCQPVSGSVNSSGYSNIGASVPANMDKLITRKIDDSFPYANNIYWESKTSWKAACAQEGVLPTGTYLIAEYTKTTD